MFYAHALRDGRGHAYVNTTTITLFAQNYTMGACLHLCGPTMHVATLCGVFRTIFFFFLLSVSATAA